MTKKPFKFTDEQKVLYDACSKLERLTVINHIQGNMSQRAAYYEAGGKSKTHKTADVVVCQILGRTRVKAFSDSLVEEMAGAAIMTREQALKILTTVASTKINEIEEYKIVPILPAIKQLAQMEGWEAASKHEHSGPDGGAIETKSMSDEDLARKIAFLFAKADKKVSDSK